MRITAVGEEARVCVFFTHIELILAPIYTLALHWLYYYYCCVVAAATAAAAVVVVLGSHIDFCCLTGILHTATILLMIMIIAHSHLRW